MILTYSNPRFKDLILSGEKIHTIREDKKMRWKPGMKIQHWMGNPRNVKKEPHQFAEGICQAVRDVVITRRYDRPEPVVFMFETYEHEGRFLLKNEIYELAKNDGLTIDEFREWFVPESLPDFRGRIIHFTDKLY